MGTSSRVQGTTKGSRGNKLRGIHETSKWGGGDHAKGLQGPTVYQKGCSVKGERKINLKAGT